MEEMNEVEIKFKDLLDKTDYKASDIWKKLGYGSKTGRRLYLSIYSKEEREKRHKRILSLQKEGNKNPMYGKVLNQHHNYIGEISDGKGYLMILKPDWYTGRKGCKHVFVHHIKICEELGLTEIPSGWNIHHIDGNKQNNNLNNLALLTLSAHRRLHSLEGATTISKESRGNASKRKASTANDL